MRRLLVFAGLLLLSFQGFAEEGMGDHGGMHNVPPDALFNNEEALALSQSVRGHEIGDYQFRDRRGNPVTLRDYLGKPLLISLIYTSCYHICPTTTRHLADVVRNSRSVLGDDSFNVLTIGFDTATDNPAMMARFAEAQGVDDENWWFLSSDPETISRITKDLGFIFYPSPRGFDHLIQTSLISSDGKVHRQVYGMEFSAPLLVEPLKNLVFDKPGETSLIATLSNRIKLFCTVYDPANEKYRTDYSIFLGSFIALTSVGLFGFLLLKEWRLSVRATAAKSSESKIARR